MNIIEPIPINRWQTSDGQVHDTHEQARRHEVFLAVKGDLPNHTDPKVAYAVVKALAARYDFVERVREGASS